VAEQSFRGYFADYLMYINIRCDLLFDELTAGPSSGTGLLILRCRLDFVKRPESARKSPDVHL